MQSRTQKLISLSALAFCCVSVRAQMLPADSFFHRGAHAYLTNNVGKALETVTNGLALYPKDEKLLKLEELLKQQQQQQNQDCQSSDQQQSDSSKDKQQKDQPQKDQKDKSSPDQKKPEPQKPEEQKQQPQPAKKGDDQQKPEEKETGQAAAPGEMTPQEAKQLLDGQKNDERLIPVSRKEKPQNPQRKLKDW
ncbi:MAG: hypothetical protein U1F65_01950 [Verrucomicrobiota bacterium]